ncbi:MAG: DNA polymerase III subunit delta' [Anaerolineales bacterium]
MTWGILGHEWAVALLKEHIANQRARHAYLFSGPSGVGRRTLALRFSHALNCPEPTAPGEPCRACRTCLQIESMQHPDLSLVQAEQVGGVLKVDQVRELQRSLSLTPYQARYRIAVLLRFEEANPSASNALLKTLEEPPQHVVLILTAESGEALLPTIVSRCELLRLRPLTLETVQQGLETQWNIPTEQARLLAHLSGGRIGYALRLNQHPELMQLRQRLLDDHSRLLSASRVERFAYAESLAKDKEMLRQALETWQALWRDVLLRVSGSTAPLANLDQEQEIEKLSGEMQPNSAYQMVDLLQRHIGMLESNVNARLATEVLMLELPHL